MTPDLLKRAADLFDQAIRLTASERAAFLDLHCPANSAPELRSLLTDLLKAHDDQDAFLATPAPAPPDSAASTALPPGVPAAKPGERVGKYKLLECIGEGGFGEVWVAEQEKPVRRKVALKIVKAGMDTREVLARFEAERQALAVMDHPNVARVFDAGATDSGRPYFVMEHVPGVPITAYCDSSRMKIRDRLGLLIDVCSAVQHAHQKGIIHRDLKPGNILVTLHDGKPIPKVIDFGIAKAAFGRLTERTLYTETGRVIGTPEYMSPEQAGTTGMDVDTRADIYSLGVLLYQLLTGTLPFDGQTLREAGFDGMAKIIREAEPPKPSTRVQTLATEKVNRTRGATPEALARSHGADVRTLQRDLRGDLDWITMKALEKDRTRRYETASAFAEDIHRHLTGEPVIAAPPSLAYRAQKFVRKHRGQVAAVVAVSATFFVGLGGTVWQWNAARNLNSMLLDQFAILRNALERVAIEPWGGGVAAPEMTVTDDSGRTLGRILVNRESLRDEHPEFSVLDSNEQPLDGVGYAKLLGQWAIDAQRRAIEAREELASQRDAAEWNAYTANLSLAQSAMAADNYPEARRRLAACPESQRGWEWRFLQIQAKSVTLAIPECSASAFSPDGKLLAAASGTSAHIFDTASGQQLARLLYHKADIHTIGFDRTGMRAFTASLGHANLWRARTGERIWSITDFSPIIGAAISLDGSRLLLNQYYQFQTFDLDSGKPLSPPVKFTDEMSDFKFDSSGKSVLAIAGNRVCLWSASSGDPLSEPLKHDESVRAAEFSHDGARVATVSDDTVRLWNARSGKLLGEPMKHEASVDAVEFNADGTRILARYGYAWRNRTHTHEGSVRLWHAESCKLVGDLMLQGDYVTTALFSSDGTRVVTGTEDGIAQIWAASSGRSLGEPLQAGRFVTAAVFSPDGKRVFTACDDDTLRVWDDEGRELGCHVLARQRVGTELRMSRDGRCLIARVVGRGINFILVLPTEELDSHLLRLPRKPARELQIAAATNPAGGNAALGPAAATLSFRPDGHGSIRVTGIPNQPTPVLLAGLDAEPSAADYSALAGRLATGGPDRLVRLWNTGTWRITATISTESHVKSLRFTPDGTRLILTCADESATIWDTRDYKARQEDRDARFKARKPVGEYVDRLLAGSLPTDDLERHVFEDSSLTALQRLLANDLLQKPIAEINTEAERAFEAMKSEHITPTRVRAAADVWTPPASAPQPFDPAPPAARVKAAIQKLAAEWKPDANDLNGFAWEVVKQPGASADRVQDALEAAREAARLAPDDAAARNTLGVAQYRAGEFAGCIATLRQSETLHATAGEWQASDLIFSAMARYRLGQVADARAILARVRNLSSRPDSELDEESRAFMTEAEALIEPPGRTASAPAAPPAASQPVGSEPRP